MAVSSTREKRPASGSLQYPGTSNTENAALSRRCFHQSFFIQVCNTMAVEERDMIIPKREGSFPVHIKARNAPAMIHAVSSTCSPPRADDGLCEVSRASLGSSSRPMMNKHHHHAKFREMHDVLAFCSR